MIRIKKGLNLPIQGSVDPQTVEQAETATAALVGADYIGMRPTMLVEVGDQVKLGSPLFSDKKNPGVVYTAPAAGTVTAINRGAKRVLQSVVIERADKAGQIELPSLAGGDPLTWERSQLAELMQTSGLWTALRTRPFSKVPAVDSEPFAIFVSVIDSEPLALDPARIIGEHQQSFALGLKALTRLSPGYLHLCHAPDFPLLPEYEHERIQTHVFSGKHPAGLVGTHMHFVAPVARNRVNWHIGYQDVIALGELLGSGKIRAERYVALGGPLVQRPQLLLSHLGADLNELCQGRLDPELPPRIVSGSVLSGRQAQNKTAFLGRYHNQVSVIKEDRERVFIRYLSPGLNNFSALPIYLSSIFGRGRRFALSSSTMGSPRAMVPIGVYEQIMPLDLLPTQLLRALIVEDIQGAVDLGCLELDEEDLSVCTFVCPGKYEYGSILRRNLELIEKEM